MSTEPQVAVPEGVDQLADEFLGRYRDGERPSITEYVHAHPDLAQEIRELFPTLVVLERLSPRQDEVAGDQIDAARTAAIPQQLGEYRILREVGRGGMGVVYEAEQLPLGRHVALKVLPAAAVLSPSVLTRFQNEVRAAARLHHTNIVPVFGVGEDQGTHYYAMQFIAGQGLDVVLDELRKLQCNSWAFPPDSKAETSAYSQPADGPVQEGAPAPAPRSGSTSHGTSLADYFQGVARMGLQVAEALAHAHSQGVLHRDIKPSNLLLDAQGCVWVTDFGLAKQAGSDVTNSGDVVGTLRYMAPERFRGASDASSDIYGLGVTLYELLTTRPAFAATDRAQLVHEIVHSDPLPLRRLERRVPRDLETIVLKAMAKRPADRYATAADVATDLRRFLDDKPIAARRQSASERLWRWCVRRPAMASLSAALLLSLAVGVAGICWQWARAELHLKNAVKQQTAAEKMLGVAQVQHLRAEQNLVEVGRQRSIAQREAARAEDNFQTARRSVNELLTLVSEDDLMDQPGLQPVRLKLLTKAIEFHEQMFADRDHDPAARRDLALAYLRLGMLKRQMGPVAEEVAAYRRAIALLESADARSDRESVILLAKAYNNLAVRQVDDKQTAEAQSTVALARERIDQVLAGASDDNAARLVSAMTFNNLAYSISESLELDHDSRKNNALEIHEQALSIYRRAAENNPHDLGLKNHIATTLSNMGRRHISLRNSDQARRIFQECLAIRLEIAERLPSSLSAQSNVAATLDGLGDTVRSSADRTSQSVAQAASDYRRSIEIRERLARENPAVLTYRHDLAGTLENLSDLYSDAGESIQELHWRRRETAAIKACLDLQPGSLPYRVRWAKQLEEQATLEAALGLHAQSLATRLQIREAWRPIHEQPEVAWEPHRDAIQLNLARLMVELGMQNQPAELYKVALERRELAGGSAGDLLELSSDLQRATLAATRAVTLDSQAQEVTARCHELAVALFRQAAQIAPGEAAQIASRRLHMRRFAALLTLDADPAKAADDPGRLHDRGRILQLIGDSLGAQADMDRALQLLDAQLSEATDNRQALRVRAVVHFDQGRWEQVIADSSRAMALRSDDVTMLSCRGRTCLHLERWQQAHEDLSRAITLRPQRIDLWPQRCRAAFEAGRVDEARADAARLVELAGDDVQQVEILIWGLLVDRQVPRFPEASLALAHRAGELATQATHRRPLGGVYFQLGRHQEAVDAVLLDEINGPGETAAFAAFWLAMSYHHLGQHDEAQQMFELGVRNWKAAAVLTPGREEYLRATWQEARSLLFGSEPPAARS